VPKAAYTKACSFNVRLQSSKGPCSKGQPPLIVFCFHLAAAAGTATDAAVTQVPIVPVLQFRAPAQQKCHYRSSSARVLEARKVEVTRCNPAAC